MGREICVVCSSGQLRPVFEILDFPAYMGVSESPRDSDIFYTQNWQECESCNGLQLEVPIPMEILYSNNHHLSPIGSTWKEHHVEFASFVSEFTKDGDSVLEIGAADGYLANLLLHRRNNLNYTVVEPSPNISNESINVVTGYIEDHIQKVNQNQVIIHSHVLEHVYKPRDFFFELASEMAVNGILCISIPNIRRLMETFGSNSLNFEHTYYLDGETIEYWANLAGLSVVNSKAFKQHSIFFVLTKLSDTPAGPARKVSLKYKIQPLTMFSNMWDKLKNFAIFCNEVLRVEAGPIYLFGAHVFSQSLIAAGLCESYISKILDNDSAKQGHRLYGTNLEVASPKVLEDSLNPFIILCVSHYQKEIREQIYEINPRAQLLELN